MVFIDSIIRLLPGDFDDPDYAIQGSFVSGLLDHPQYSRPTVVDGMAVPDILLSGHHQAMKARRCVKSLINTW